MTDPVPGSTDLRLLDTALPLVPDVLYRIGVAVPAAGLSWVPIGTPGYDAINCYAFVSGEETIFIDTGAAAARHAVRAAIEGTLAGYRRSVFITRNEAENIGNLAELLTGEGHQLLFGGGGGILEWIHRPSSNGRGEENLVGAAPLVPANNGMIYQSATGLRFHWMDAPIKQMFLTQWAYEEETRTMFSSDFFAWHHLRDPDQVPVISDPGLVPSFEVIANEIVCRVNWIRGARLDERIDLLRQTFRARPVERIAAVHGSVIEGADTVQLTLERTLQALEALGWHA